jgi:alpha-galactosidase
MKRHRAVCAAFASVALLAWAVSASVEPVPAAGPPPGELKLPVALAEASASLGESYAPDRICDGDRRTKWVSPLRPSSTQPQWVTLTLAQGPRLVTGLALFGERVDNDGVLDADIQVETAGGFRTVASVRDASTDAWLARFEPVPASQVRLLVLRSGGPTAHTDVWEVEVWGQPLEETEIRARLPEAVDREAATDTLSNGQVAVAWDPGRAEWSATWAGPAAPAIRGARFSVEVDGATLSTTPDSTQVRRFHDSLGSGQALVQVWRQGRTRIERELSVYDGQPVVTLGGRMVNEGPVDVRLGTVHLLQLSAEGSWSLGTARESPAAVYLQGHSLLRSRPFPSEAEPGSERAHDYRSSGVLALASRDPAAVLVLGYVRADEASPDVSATFRPDAGGTALTAASRFLGRVLGPGETLELNRLYVSAGPDPFRALEDYGDALARFSPSPVRTGATSLWCSWYAHRMGMTEEKVLANAAVAAKHLQPLGLEIMQLDHGWQRGDITGDWVPNERFPHGLRWLADELERRHGLRLGVWIAPTDVAETSELYRQHPDWMLRGADGQPRVNWRWYWVPNPDCYELDATQPAAYREIVETFRRLTAEGVRYYKIDFIAAAAGEHFVPHDPKTTRGWSPLRRAMEAIREGAGDQAWIRYCQTPPLLSVGLANSAYGGDDTLDAGIPGRFDVLRDNAHALAAGWWLNDRPYHREVCDMSVRMQGSVEEVRVRAALMTLANCSISWSDELGYLPPSRIRLMQQCLPPGNPPMRPLDLFLRAVPSVWHLKLTNSAETWDAVGLFNFESAPEVRAVRFAELGLDPQAEFAVFEFWEERFLGVHRGGFQMTLPGETSRILSLRRVTGRPQLVGTDMHLLQGWHEIKDLTWDPAGGVLAGVYQRMPGITGKAFVLVPPGYAPRFEFPLGPASARLTHIEGPLWMQEIEFTQREHPWRIPFEVPKPAPAQEPAGS